MRPEEEMLLSSGRILHGEEEHLSGLRRALPLSGKGLDWGYFFRRAGEEKVIPQVHVSLSLARSRGVDLGIPKKAWSLFERKYFDLLKRDMLLHDEVSRFRGFLESRGIPFMAIKGFSLRGLYSEDSFREVADADFVFRNAGDFGLAEGFLRELGYVLDDANSPRVFYGSMVKKKYFKTVEGGGRAYVDIHSGAFWCKVSNLPLFSYTSPVCALIEDETLWERSRREGGDVFPSPEDSALIVCCHAFGDVKRFTLRDVNDLHVIASRYDRLDWNYVIEHVRSRALEPYFKTLLAMTLEVYGPNPRLEDALSGLGEDPPSRIAAALIRKGGVYMIAGAVTAQLRYAVKYLRKKYGLATASAVAAQILLLHGIIYSGGFLLRLLENGRPPEA